MNITVIKKFFLYKPYKTFKKFIFFCKIPCAVLQLEFEKGQGASGLQKVRSAETRVCVGLKNRP